MLARLLPCRGKCVHRECLLGSTGTLEALNELGGEGLHRRNRLQAEVHRRAIYGGELGIERVFDVFRVIHAALQVTLCPIYTVMVVALGFGRELLLWDLLPLGAAHEAATGHVVAALEIFVPRLCVHLL